MEISQLDTTHRMQETRPSAPGLSLPGYSPGCYPYPARLPGISLPVGVGSSSGGRSGATVRSQRGEGWAWCAPSCLSGAVWECVGYVFPGQLTAFRGDDC